MMRGIKTAYNKLVFCYRTTGSISDFLRLLINTKRYSRNKKVEKIDYPVLYQLKLGGVYKLLRLRTYSGDIDMLYEIFWQRVYNNTLISWNNFSTIVDLGANIGMTSLFFGLQSPGAVIYALEPDPENFELLITNLSREITGSRLIPVAAAISSDNGVEYLHKKQKSYNSSVSGIDISDTEVRAVNMPTFMREMFIDEIDLLKIDIEGKEAELFSRDLAWLEKVRNIVMECHSEDIRKHAIVTLKTLGFDVYPGNNGRSYADIIWAIR